MNGGQWDGEWKWLPIREGNGNSSQPPSLTELPLQNTYEALDPEGQLDDIKENYLSGEPPNYTLSVRQMTTSSIKKKRRVVLVGDSLLRGTEGPICRPDPSHREVCCLPGARVWDITERLPRLIEPSDYYSLLILQAGSDEIEKKSARAIKRDFRALGHLIDRAGPQIVFCSVTLLEETNDGRNRRVYIFNKGLKVWRRQQNFGFFDHEETFMAPGLLEPDGLHLSVKGKRVLAHELAELIETASN
ncbi:hypothetical protein HGM15179_020329 [Zosterops borbonicus]|uniref:SGNH hydrolase-type esterase domain-containing protein n=1 Tax=Zosterops borbonicus TaxID=364589 RepID=A0A8K1D9D9_9PASS|nr:hypothetical protein HGM15179_020329 [Zosterops borbonicus]